MQRNTIGEVVTIVLPLFVLAPCCACTSQKRSMGDRVRERSIAASSAEAYNTEKVLSELAVQARSIADPATLIQTISGRISEVLHVQQMAVLLRSGSVFELQTAGGPSLGGALVRGPNIRLPCSIWCVRILRPFSIAISQTSGLPKPAAMNSGRSTA